MINNTDSMSDYFDNDRFYISEGHPLFNAAARAYAQREIRHLERRSRKNLDEYGRKELERTAAELAAFVEAHAWIYTASVRHFQATPAPIPAKDPAPVDAHLAMLETLGVI